MILRILGYGALYFLAFVGGGASLGEALAKHTGHPGKARAWAGIGALIGLLGLGAAFLVQRHRQQQADRAWAAAQAAQTAPATPTPAASPAATTSSASTSSAAISLAASTSPDASLALDDSDSLVSAGGVSGFGAFAHHVHGQVPAPVAGAGFTQALALE